MDQTARPPSEVLPGELRALRRHRGWTQQELADQLEELGASIDRSTVAKIESGGRRLTIDEVFLFAAALEVSPLALLLPRREEVIAVAPKLNASSTDVLQWARGVHPLGLTDPAEAGAYRLFYEARPDYEAAAIRRRPGIRDLWMLAHLAMVYAGADEEGALVSLQRVLGYLSADAGAELAKLDRDLPEAS